MNENPTFKAQHTSARVWPFYANALKKMKKGCQREKTCYSAEFRPKNEQGVIHVDPEIVAGLAASSEFSRPRGRI